MYTNICERKYEGITSLQMMQHAVNPTKRDLKRTRIERVMLDWQCSIWLLHRPFWKCAAQWSTGVAARYSLC